jgi:single-strand DNA-binding protein
MIRTRHKTDNRAVTQSLVKENNQQTSGDETMIDALISGKLIQSPVCRTGQSGKPFTNFLLSVAIGEDQPVVVSGISFGEAAEKIGRLAKGDSVSVIGSLKPSSWSDKVTGGIGQVD